MTDLFRRLAARAQGSEHRLRPQVQGLFEPQGVDTGGFTEITEATDVVAPARRPAVTQETPRAPDPARQAPHSDSPPPRQRTTTAPLESHQATQHTRPQQPSPPAPLPAAIVREAHLEQREVRHERVETELHDRPSPPTPARPPADAPAPVVRAEDRPPSPSAAETAPPRNEEPAPAVPGLPTLPLQAQVVPTRLARPGEERPTWPPRAERRVHIHIERIEVRQASSQAKTPPRPQRPANPAPDLDDYLRRRRS